MTKRVKLLDAASATGSVTHWDGGPASLFLYAGVWNSATAKLQYTPDGTNFIDVSGASATANQQINLSLPEGDYRINISGSPTSVSADLVELQSSINIPSIVPTELNGVMAGTVSASKAVVVSADKDIGDFRNLDAVNIDAGASGTVGTVDVFPATASKGKLAISVTDQTGDTTVSLVAGAMAAARTITIRDPGAAASFLTTTDATAAATAATAVELTRIADVSARLVAVGGTSLAVTEALHSDKIIKLDHTAAASTCTLPDATGSGAVFRFIVSAVNTNNHVITVPDASNVLKGSVNILDNDSNAQTAYAASGTDDTLTLNGTTTGGQIGDWVELVDIAADTWAIRGQLVVPAGSNPADPFSAAV